MRSRFLYLLFIIFFLLSNEFVAQEAKFGLGIMIGEPTGFNAKYFFNEINALDCGLAYSFVKKNSAVSIHFDYLYHNYDLIKSKYRLLTYYGFGARLRFVEKHDNSLGARGIIGLIWLVDIIPVDVFFEFVPVFNIFPATALDLDIALGARYYLK